MYDYYCQECGACVNGCQGCPDCGCYEYFTVGRAGTWAATEERAQERADATVEKYMGTPLSVLSKGHDSQLSDLIRLAILDAIQEDRLTRS